MSEVNPPCDRCGHRARDHFTSKSTWSDCKLTDCPCDGYFPKNTEREQRVPAEQGRKAP